MKVLIDNIIRRGLAHRCHKKKIRVDNQKIVSFTFDDAYHSAFENGGAILKKYNSNGTFYVSMSFMNRISEKSLFSKEELRRCVNDGHEIGGHTFTHFSAYDVDRDKLVEDTERNRNEFSKLNLGVEMENFAYPCGHQVRMVKKYMGEIYKTNRGTSSGVNSGNVDLNNLKAVKLYEDRYSLSDIFSLLEKLKKTGGWLIFYTHDVKLGYSKMGCSPKYFEEVVKRTVDLKLPIKNIKDALLSCQS